MDWLEIYVPLTRLDTGLLILLVIWIVTIIVSFYIPFKRFKPEHKDQ